MAGPELNDPAKALEYKEKGNKCFQIGDYIGAEALYTKAYVQSYPESRHMPQTVRQHADTSFPF